MTFNSPLEMCTNLNENFTHPEILVLSLLFERPISTDCTRMLKLYVS